MGFAATGLMSERKHRVASWVGELGTLLLGLVHLVTSSKEVTIGSSADAFRKAKG